MSRLIEKYRKEAHDLQYGDYNRTVSWRHAILEAIFRPEIKVPGKEPLSHLHPDIDKLHLPDHVKIADWRKYRVEDHPALMNFQKRCHAAGLHDPWLRNFAYAWYPNMIGQRSRFALITQGCVFGFFAGAAIYIGEKIYDHYFPTIYIHTEEYIEKYGTGERHHH